MVCAQCWYCAKVGMRGGVKLEEYQCVNPKSDYFAKTVERAFECSLFSDSDLPDPEAEKIILDPELMILVRRKEDDFVGEAK